MAMQQNTDIKKYLENDNVYLKKVGEDRALFGQVFIFTFEDVNATIK